MEFQVLFKNDIDEMTKQIINDIDFIIRFAKKSDY